jgi:hypothetical protein
VNRKIEIFRAGKQTDSNGNAKEWTVADLDKIASSYDPSFHEAPVCIGHPKENAPAWAWIKTVSREGQSLFAEIGDEAPEFSDWLEKKRYKKRSISLYPDLKVRHLAFLGAQAPAVKGLADFQEGGSRFLSFSEADTKAEKGESITLDFADWSTVWSFRSLGNLFQGIRDHFIDTKDLETANRLVPQYEIDALKSMQADPEKAALYQETDMNQQEFDTKLAAEVAKTVAAEAKATDFSEKLTAANGRVATLETEINGIKSAAQDKDLNEFCESLVTAGKLLPADKATTIAVMKALSTQSELDFAEGDKTVKKAPLAMFQERLNAGPKVIEFGETVTKGNSLEAKPDDKLTALTKAKMAENKGMNYAEAGRAVLAEHPELNFSTDAE